MKTHAIALAFLALSIGSAVEGQEAGQPLAVSISAGLGAGTLGIGGQGSLSVSHRSGDYILRASGTSDFAILDTPESTEDFALLYGRRSRSNHGWARAALGVGFVRRVERGEVEECVLFFCRREELTSTGFGLASHVDLVWTPADAFGLGLTGVANLNSRQSFAALAVSVHLGSVR